MAVVRSVKTLPEVYVAVTSGSVAIKGRVIRYVQGRTHIDPRRPVGRALMRAVPGSFAPMRIDFDTPEALDAAD